MWTVMMERGPEPGRPLVGFRDVALALVVCALMVIGTGVSLEDDFGITVSEEGSPWLPAPVGLILVTAGSLVLVVRRVFPLTVLTLAGAASLAYQAVTERSEPLPLPVLVALYTIAVSRRPLVVGLAAAAYVFSFTVAALTGWLSVTDDQYYTDLIAVVATVMLGYGVALGRARATLAEQRATALARHQEGRMRAAVEQEQARIAREVHDIVAHDVSVMVAQAAAGRRVFATQPRTALDALSSIEAVGRDALDGLRRLVGLLRTEPPGAPQPERLDRLPWLLEQVRRAGLPVDLVVLGDRRPLPATIELNAYRIVQEALTNSLKHGGRTGATVTFDYRGESLRVEIRDLGGDTGRVARPSSPGYGLVSMQQRAELLGGQLEAGPEADRGYRVSVVLPLAGGTG